MRKYALFLMLLIGCRELTNVAIRRMRLCCLLIILSILLGAAMAIVLDLWWLHLFGPILVGLILLRLFAIGALYKVETVTVAVPMSDHHGIFSDKSFSFVASNCQIYVCEDSQMTLCPLKESRIHLIRSRRGCYCTFGEIPTFLYAAWISAD